jgi:hypothetical protein
MDTRRPAVAPRSRTDEDVLKSPEAREPARKIAELSGEKHNPAANTD